MNAVRFQGCCRRNDGNDVISDTDASLSVLYEIIISAVLAHGTHSLCSNISILPHRLSIRKYFFSALQNPVMHCCQLFCFNNLNLLCRNTGLTDDNIANAGDILLLQSVFRLLDNDVDAIVIDEHHALVITLGNDQVFNA